MIHLQSVLFGMAIGWLGTYGLVCLKRWWIGTNYRTRK